MMYTVTYHGMTSPKLTWHDARELCRFMLGLKPCDEIPEDADISIDPT